MKSPSRWAWTAPIVAMAYVVACDEGFNVSGQAQTWGFVQVAAAKSQSGQHVISPEAFFFKGVLSGIPNAAIVLDSCSDAPFSTGNTLSGVTYLDAGSPVTTSVGGRLDTLPRTVTGTGTTYKRAIGADIPFTPGDSIVVTVPGAVGGYPNSTIRGKTAEALTLQPIAMPSGNQAMQLRWNLPSNQLDVAMILSLRYAPANGNGQLSRQVVCSFTDDGVDSIPFQQYQTWINNSGTLENIIATRLRTSFATVADGLLEVIATYQYPTPIR